MNPGALPRRGPPPRGYPRIAVLTLAFGLSAACGAGEERAEEPQNPPSSMPAMEGMDDMGQSGTMMAEMAAHMEMMEGLSGDSALAMLPAHRQRVANVIAQMNREMREMAMAGDGAWDATVDSLRSDLVAMPEMDAAELRALLPAHSQRVLRLMEMHGQMMAGPGT